MIRCRIFKIWRMRAFLKAQSLQTALTFVVLIRFWNLLILSIRNIVFCLIENFYIIKLSGTRGTMLLLDYFFTKFSASFKQMWESFAWRLSNIWSTSTWRLSDEIFMEIDSISSDFDQDIDRLFFSSYMHVHD